MINDYSSKFDGRNFSSHQNVYPIYHVYQNVLSYLSSPLNVMSYLQIYKCHMINANRFLFEILISYYF